MDNMELSFITDVVKPLMSEKRFVHTLGVAEEAYRLGQIIIPEKCEKLSIAGLLHDITKDFSDDEQLQLCKKYGIEKEIENLSPKLWHAKTGCEFARRSFGEDVVDAEIYNAISRHTTGAEGMTLFDAIIYISDYIEKNRTFSDCVMLRNYFYVKLEKCNTIFEKKELFQRTLLLSFNVTIKGLIDEGKMVDFDTVKARNYFLKNKNCF